MSYNATENSASRRIATLLDEGSFVEIGGAVTARSTTFNLQEKAAPSDGVITGYGVIDGNLVYVYSQDADVLGGALGEMHAKKIARIYDMAMKMGAPVIGLIDCAGLRLQEATDALEAFGSLYHKQALASGVIPQVTAIFGMCGGGLAVVPGLTDFTFMEAKDGKLFVNSPNALEGNEISKLIVEGQAERFEKNPDASSFVWDALTAAVWLHPEIATDVQERYLTVDTNYGPDYGHAVSWWTSRNRDVEAKEGMPYGVQKCNILFDIDREAFWNFYVDTLTEVID